MKLYKKINFIRISHLGIMIFLFSGIKLFAQWNFSFSTSQEANSNPFRSINAEADVISSYDLGIETEIENFSLLYYGSYSGFKNAVDYNFYWHQIGLYSSTETSIWGAYFEQRINKDLNNYIDYLNFVAYYRKSFMLAQMKWQLNTSLASTQYQNITDFNNWVGSISLSGNKGFASKTTLIGKKFKYFTEKRNCY